MIVNILGLGSILNEEGVTHSVIGDVVEHSEVVDSVSGHSTVVGLMDRVTLDIGLVDGSDHVEMNWVATKFESLTHILEFDILNSSNA